MESTFLAYVLAPNFGDASNCFASSSLNHLSAQRIEAVGKDLKKGFGIGAFEVAVPPSRVMERRRLCYLRCVDCGKIRQVMDSGGAPLEEGEEGEGVAMSCCAEALRGAGGGEGEEGMLGCDAPVQDGVETWKDCCTSEWSASPLPFPLSPSI